MRNANGEGESPSSQRRLGPSPLHHLINEIFLIKFSRHSTYLQGVSKVTLAGLGPSLRWGDEFDWRRDMAGPSQPRLTACRGSLRWDDEGLSLANHDGAACD